VLQWSVLRLTRLVHKRSGVRAGDKRVNSFRAWILRLSDVGTMPVPAAVWLFGSGLLGMVGVASKAKDSLITVRNINHNPVVVRFLDRPE